MGDRGPTVLCILDGWGISPDRKGNATMLAATPNIDHVRATCPSALLTTHGPAVGLPPGQMGNSEVGHMNIGAGRVVPTDIVRINRAIADGSFATRPGLAEFIKRVSASGGTAHLMALMSDGGVHGHLDHLAEATRVLALSGLRVAIHALLDGRDVGPKSAGRYLESAKTILSPQVRIATLGGRYFAMDRDKRWDRISQAWNAVVHGRGARFAAAQPALEASHGAGRIDEFMFPCVIGEYQGMTSGDGFFLLNFRGDRVRQFLSALLLPGFDGFNTGPRPRLAACLGMVPYADQLAPFMASVFERQRIRNTLGEWVARHDRRQFRLAETEKYPHVTWFLDGGAEIDLPGQEQHMPPSPKVATYDLSPKMASVAVGRSLVGAIDSGFDLVVVNFANPDMVGHTGNLAAAVSACEAVDCALGPAIAATRRARGTMLLCSDHGNCEAMVDQATGGPHTAHTLNPVPIWLVGGRARARLRDGRLADLAPTVLDVMGLDQPWEMTGCSLISR